MDEALVLVAPAFEGASLLTLPLEVLETICQPLSLKDRIHLTSCCRALLARPDLASSAALWGNLALSQQRLGQLAQGSMLGALAAWLARRRTGCRRLRLSWSMGAGPDALGLLGSLEGGALRALELSGPAEAVRGWADEMFQLLPRLGALTRLELRGGFLHMVPLELSVLTGLVALDISRNQRLGLRDRGVTTADLPPPNGHTLGMLRGLTKLDISNCGLRRLPADVSALQSLAELDADCNFFGWAGHSEGAGGGVAGAAGGGGAALDASDRREAAALAPLQHLTALTRLSLKWCSLRALPPYFTALSSLVVLDVSRNSEMGRGGPAALSALGPPLGALTQLDLSFCGLDTLPPNLPSLGGLVVLALGGNLSLGSAPLGQEGSEAGFQALRQLTALTRLDLTGCNVAQRLFDLLSSLTAAGVCVRF